MSKVKKNSVVENQPDNLAPVPQPKKRKAKKQGVFARICAFLLAVLSVAAFFIPLLGVEGKQMLFSTVLDLPKLTGVEAPSSIAALAAYSLAAALLLTFVLSVVAVCSTKKASPRVCKAFGAFTFGTIVYTIVMMAIAEMDTLCLALAAIGLVCGIIGAFKNNGKGASLFILQTILTIAAFALVALGFGEATLEETEMITVVGVGLMVFSVFLGCIRIGAKGALAIDLIRYVLTLAGAVILGIVIAGGNAGAKTLRTYSIIAILIAVVQILIVILQMRHRAKAAVKEATAEFESSFQVEEYAEAFPYEGGPVAGVRMAEEVNPTFTTPPPHINTAGYDFYNCKSFDPFIALLDAEERNQFTELFILKYKGVMPEIPDYQVGGDNKEFFRKIFIYLGQYRDRIPSGLLAKIYQFSLKIS